MKENAPEIYKPREGKVNKNLDKFSKEQLQFMYAYAQDLITNFGYASTFNASIPASMKNSFMESFNQEAFKKSQFNLKESDEITSIFINFPSLLLRKKSALYPDGRTSYRFKRQLRKKVTILEK